MHILIAEDSFVIQVTQKALMDKWNFHYDLVANGEEAVEYARKNNGKKTGSENIIR